MLLHYLEQGEFRTGDGSRVASAGLAALDTGQVTLVLPAVITGLVHVPVTRREFPHLQKSLPWMLEEQLGVAPESLHFAHGPLQDGQVAVVYVDRNRLSDVLQECAAQGLVPARVISELQLVPWKPGCWSLQFNSTTGQCMIRDGRGRGLVCSHDNLEPVLAVMAQQDTPRCIYSPTLGKSEVQMIPDRYRSALEHGPSTMSLPALAASAVNFRQREFAVPLPWAQWWKQWRWAAVLVLGLFLADTVITLNESRMLERRLQAAEDELSATFQDVMPGARMVDPVLQLRRAVALLDGSEQAGLLSMLTRMSPALSDNTANAVQNISWDDGTGELQLLMTTDSFSAAEQFRTNLEKLGLQAELLDSSSDASGSRARLRIRS